MAQFRFMEYVCRLLFYPALIYIAVNLLIAYYSDSIREPPAPHSHSHPRPEDVFKPSKGDPTVKRPAAKAQTEEVGRFFPKRYHEKDLVRWTPLLTTNPGQGPGESGRPVVIPPEEEAIMKEQFILNEFNVYASDLMSINRSVPDFRHSRCRTDPFPGYLPTTSVVIVFHNEAWSTMLRTIWSVINRSPKELVEEIILVDDASDRDYLGKQLEDYVANLPLPVKVLRTDRRAGIVTARILGAKAAKGKVLTYLDAHCECSDGWLEPLLARIYENRKIVAAPVIDIISDDTFEYIGRNMDQWGGFNWKLEFCWFIIPQREINRRKYNPTLPFRTPAMAGGLFAIDKEYFFEIGTYDEGMEIWGGENLEMSFRVWSCGGMLEIVPCSRVGHVFRKKTPYTLPGGPNKVVYHNNRRLAEVWLGQWADFFYLYNTDAINYEISDISERLQLKKDMKCKSFEWYLRTVYPESTFPINYYYLGDIRNAKTGQCLDVLEFHQEVAETRECHGEGGNQLFLYNHLQQIINNDHCLEASSAKRSLAHKRCSPSSKIQGWQFDEKTGALKHLSSNLCLSINDPGDERKVILRPCDMSLAQQWIMDNPSQWQYQQEDV